MEDARFSEYSAYLRRKYGRPPGRVAVDAGFTCPNRLNGGGGCLYCGDEGSRAPYQDDPVAAPGARGRPSAAAAAAQAARGLARLAGRGGPPPILYFQAFTGTFAPLDELRAVYDAGLAAGVFSAMAVATRPDCVDRDVAGLLASYIGRPGEVWVELGLQSSSSATLARIGRGHGPSDFARACGLLKDAGVKVAAHLILGLPGEGRAEILESARFVAGLGVDGVKFHDLRVPRFSRLGSRFPKGEYILLCRSAYLGLLADAIELLPPETLVMRLNCDIDDSRRLMPTRAWDKAALKRDLIRLLEERGTRQGSARPSGARRETDGAGLGVGAVG